MDMSREHLHYLARGLSRYIHDKELKKRSADTNMAHLKQIIEIMNGNESSIQRAMGNWQEGLAGILTYQSPMVQATDIQ